MTRQGADKVARALLACVFGGSPEQVRADPRLIHFANGTHALRYGVGDGLGPGESPVAGAPKPVCRATAAPKLLKIATPIPS